MIRSKKERIKQKLKTKINRSMPHVDIVNIVFTLLPSVAVSFCFYSRFEEFYLSF